MSRLGALGVCASLMLGLHGAGAVAAAPPALVVNGACRDGVAHGAYELRGRDGRLRASGAFRDGKRTGTFVFWSDSGARQAVIPYEDDLRTGTIALWHPPPNARTDPLRALEAPTGREGAAGMRRSWYRSGQLRYAARYESDRLVEASAWDEGGHRLPDARARKLAQDERTREEAALERFERLVATHHARCNE